MQPYLSIISPMFVYYRYLPYIAVLVVMWLYGERLQRYFLIYMGASLLGLAFVSFALVYQSTAGLILTTIFIEAAYAFLDLYIWTTLGDLAFIYGAPFQFFGYALAAMLLSILAGELIGVELLKIGEQYRLVTALFAATAIYLTYTVIPWLNNRMQQDYCQFASNENAEGGEEIAGAQQKEAEGGGAAESPLAKAVKLLLPDQKLTSRETEIVALLLRGMANRDIAARLFISENTLKTHLRNIYHKYGISHKRELLYMVEGDRLFFCLALNFF